MLIALRTAVALFATARPNHFRMIRSELSPKPWSAPDQRVRLAHSAISISIIKQL